MDIKELTAFLNEYFAISDYQDSSLNGLQVEGNSEINKVALAVDACSETFSKASALRADLLFVHHGLYWGKPFALTGFHADRIKLLFNNELSLYAVHLPLDLHPETGNNAGILKMLDVEIGEPFGEYHGIKIGYRGTLKDGLKYDDLLTKLEKTLNTNPSGYKFGSDRISNIAVISGGGASMLEQTIGSNIDTFITGESDHVSYHTAKELGINLIFCGHYATETVGVKNVGGLLEEKFGLETVFLDVPTGM
ncbi:MAG: Nif3-like dinuclear metal center hexameric protein [bacterium]|nr:Nif3-like dinuclear metal center hexameric protein [bacterium]